MEYCQVCGGKLDRTMQYCPHCGKSIPGRDEEAPRDFWAERLKNSELEADPEPDEDWTEEVPDDQLQDLNSGETLDAPSDFWEKKQQEKKKKRKNRLTMAAFSVLVLLGITMVWWLGRPPVLPDLPGSGIYYGQYCSDQENTISMEGDLVELLSDGRVRLELLGKADTGQWIMEDQKIRIQLERRSLEGTCADGVLTLRDKGLTYILTMEGCETAAVQAQGQKPQPETEAAVSYDSWAGDYYGWMVILDGSGRWKNQDGKASDICGRISLTAYDEGKIQLWADSNKKGQMLCYGDVIFRPGAAEAGRMQLEWGIFQDAEMKSGTWVVDPGKSPVSAISHMLYISGRFTDPQSPEDSYSYQIFLRPWGMDWEDVRHMEESDLPWNPMVPPRYESWYLPLIGQNQPMPDQF